MKKILFLLVLIFPTSIQAQTIKKYTPAEMEKWQSLGKGKGYVIHDQFYMEEVERSLGYMVFSPEKYNDVILRYDVITMNPATVLVVLLNASDIGASNDLKITNENNGSFGFWTKEVEDYMFGFRVMPHNSTPYLRKHPVNGNNDGKIGEAEKDIIRPGWRYTIECGKKESKLWLKIDDETIIETTDKNPLGAGKIALRVRGTAGDLGKCMIRNLEIIGEPVK